MKLTENPRTGPKIGLFVSGMLFPWGCYMAVVDFMGLERWQQYEAEHWWDISPLWGLAIAAASILQALHYFREH